MEYRRPVFETLGNASQLIQLKIAGDVDGGPENRSKTSMMTALEEE